MTAHRDVTEHPRVAGQRGVIEQLRVVEQPRVAERLWLAKQLRVVEQPRVAEHLGVAERLRAVGQTGVGEHLRVAEYSGAKPVGGGRRLRGIPTLRLWHFLSRGLLAPRQGHYGKSRDESPGAVEKNEAPTYIGNGNHQQRRPAQQVGQLKLQGGPPQPTGL